MTVNSPKQQERKPSVTLSAGVFLMIMTVMLGGVLLLKADIHALLLVCVAIGGVASYFAGFNFSDITEGIKNSISKATTAFMIFILIGATIGTWILAGTVPSLIVYGLDWLNPGYFLPLVLVICAVTSTATGTSWGTVGTVGLAVMGMGESMGIPAPVVAGAVVSGAFFGDKMSPVSDTTNLSAATAEADLYDHIKNMSFTTVPSFALALVLYFFMGLPYGDAVTVDSAKVELIRTTLEGAFHINPIALLPLVVVLVLNILKVPAVPAMGVGVLLGLLVAVFDQGATFTEALKAVNEGYTIKSGNEMIDKLLVRGGIQNMMWTFSLSFIAICLGGVLETGRFLEVLVAKITERVRSVRHYGLMVISSCFLGNVAMGEIYLSIIVNAGLYKKSFEEKGLRNSMLSRYLEEGATLTGGLIPWTTAGAFISVTLGVDSFSYAPYAFLNLINPVLSIMLTYFGIFVFKKVTKEAETA
ncbi:Na+/H+ antiporter NhaC [Fulvitalea axinellae]|uniref:Na+/H+ antiporter NhaC n=1 Tax=Fulvitalea axinellae TaxID=1182444 RepID=A0AAU9CX03_9BACT|nr:Na+/H+ antiporter NhaC [Fulvitalea axinellae]